MKPIPITKHGLGRHTAVDAALTPFGSASDSLNLLHTTPQTAELRPGIDRVWATRAGANPVLWAFEFVKSDLSIVYLTKLTTIMYTFDALTPATALGSLQTGMTSGYRSGVVNANGMVFIADSGANYITDGTTAHSHELQKTGPEGTVTLAARVGGASGQLAGTVYYSITDLEPTTGEETPPSTASTHARLADEGVKLSGMTFTGHFTGKRVYRTKGGGTQKYLVATLAAVATTKRARATNVATITTASAHGLSVGQSVTVSGLGGTGYNATADVASVPTTTSFTYANTGGDEGETADTAGTVYKAGYLDDSLDTALTTASAVHGEDVTTASIEKPEAAKHACFHRGRLFLGNLTSLPSRLRWSRPLGPSQFETYTTARRDVGKLDGGEITGLVSFRGSLVIFKRTSIWVMNGDDDDAGFVFSEAVPGIGCTSPRSIVNVGDEVIFFLSSNGVYTFDLANLKRISGPINDEIRDLLHTTYGANFVGGYEPKDRLYLLSTTPSGQTLNTKTWVYNLDSGSWGRFAFSMGLTYPTCYSNTGGQGPIRDSNGNVCLYMGSSDGYLYKMAAATGCDGVTSGDKSGTVTSATATTTTCSAAAFRTTGNGLTGLSMTVRRAADNSYESVLISSNTATEITHPALSGTAIVATDEIYIGAIQGTLALNPTDLQTVQRKRWGRALVRFKKQSHAIPLRVGYTIDTDSAPTATTEFNMNVGPFARMTAIKGRRSQALGIYLDIIGVSCPTEITGIEFEAEILVTRGPTSR